MSYCIYISTFDKRAIKITGGIPIEVGAAMREEYVYPLHDDSGDNISYENPYYGELTGLYWVWKNTQIEDNDIIGFCHYNKALSISNGKAVCWLRNYPNGFITGKPNRIRNHPVPNEVKAMLDGVVTSGEKYLEAWNNLYDDEAAAKFACCRGGNTFITTGVQLKAYCEWLFSVLTTMRKDVGDKDDAEPYWRRYCAYAGERLLSVYIEANDLPVKSCQLRYKEWWLPLGRKMIHLLHLNKKGCLYKLLRELFGYKSQYNHNN